jgi:nickel/cobalt exporter
MSGFGWSVLVAAMAVGFIHTVLGPDHYVPFLMMSRAQHWSRARTVAVALLCGIAHVGSSVVLGGVGVVLGLTVAHLERVEGTRGSVAAWTLVAFGVAYAVWGVRRAVRRSRGIEAHDHGGHVHVHAHGNRPHHHAADASTPSVTFWALFTVFVLGPCEPLIPLFMLPASRGQWGLAAATAVVFGAVTLASMAVLTLLGVTGLERIPLGPLERWSHAMAGAVIAASGLLVIALGL